MAKLCQEVDQLIGIINEQNLAIGDVMKRLERLHFSDTVALSLQAKLMTRLANCQLFTPNNYHEAEQRVNGLLKYLSSQNYTVCTLACSLMRVFCAFLDRNGQHIATQVMTSCKNLLALITKPGEDKNQGLNLCQSVALASLCSIATDWSSKLEVQSQWLPFALLSLNAVLGVLVDQNIHCFVHQVASESLRRILKISQFWMSLTHTEKNRVLSTIKQLFDIHFSAEKPDYFIQIKFLHSVAIEEISSSIVHTHKHVRDFLDVCWKALPEINHTELDMKTPLDVRWAALKLLWTLLKAMKKHPSGESINLDKLKMYFANACCHKNATHSLKQELCNLISELCIRSNPWDVQPKTVKLLGFMKCSILSPSMQEGQKVRRLIQELFLK